MAMGCSQGASLTTPPESDTQFAASSQPANHELLGLYTFICDPAAGSIDAIPLRQTQLHLNALRLLEPPPLVKLTIEGYPKFNGNILDVNIGLRNPYPAMNQYTGFDVCGIIFTHGSMSGFNDPDIVMAGEGDTRLLNADGYTRWWNPSEFPHGDTIFNYTNGLLGTPAENADFNCTINGYKYFADGLGKDDPLSMLDAAKRGLFSPGKKNIRHYKMDLSGGLQFNYAVDACWAKPQGKPPYAVPDDFPPAANRPEAYRVEVTELENSLYFVEGTYLIGGNLRLSINVWDHFNAGLNKVGCESAVGLPYAESPSPVGGGEGFSTYEIDLAGDNLTRNGEAALLMTVESEASGYGEVLPGKPVCAYFQHTYHISPNAPPGWALTWGKEGSGYGNDVAVDSAGNIYVLGHYRLLIDFDPGPGEYNCYGWHEYDSLSKFNANGVFQWACSWGFVSGTNEAYSLALDNFGNIYVTGVFQGIVDFDPGPGVDEHASTTEEGLYRPDIFLSKFNSDGVFQWARTWGGKSGYDYGYGLVVDSSANIYVTGIFCQKVDFDPGPGVEEYTAWPWPNPFLSKFNSDGEFQWARVWGGKLTESYPHGVASDGFGGVYVTGEFTHIADFDPGPGVIEYTSCPEETGPRDDFLSKFDTYGNFQWVRVWGSEEHNEYATAISTGAGGDLFITGRFGDAVDFDPGPGTDIRSPVGDNDGYLTRFNPAGDFVSVLTWGGTVSVYPKDVQSNASGDIYITGRFTGTADFDPGPGVVEYTATGGKWDEDIFLSRFDANGVFQWARTWGGIENGRGYGVAVDDYGNSFTVGVFRGTADFDPGPGIDEHDAGKYNAAFLSKFPIDGNW
jgi:hypothetical protein